MISKRALADADARGKCNKHIWCPRGARQSACGDISARPPRLRREACSDRVGAGARRGVDLRTEAAGLAEAAHGCGAAARGRLAAHRGGAPVRGGPGGEDEGAPLRVRIRDEDLLGVRTRARAEAVARLLRRRRRRILALRRVGARSRLLRRLSQPPLLACPPACLGPGLGLGLGPGLGPGLGLVPSRTIRAEAELVRCGTHASVAVVDGGGAGR